MGLIGYKYYVPITIASSIDGELTNYQFKFSIIKGNGSNSGSTIYLNNKASNWPNDVRFVSSDGTTLIDFWREENDSTDGTWWVEVPTIPASGGTTIYLYIGNSGASDASNQGNTFIDFIDTTTLDGWTGNTSVLSLVGSTTKLLDNTSSAYSVYHPLACGTNDFILEVIGEMVDPGATDAYIGIGLFDGASPTNRFVYNSAWEDFNYHRYLESSSDITLYSGFAFEALRWSTNVRLSDSKVDHYLYNSGGLLGSAVNKSYAKGTPSTASHFGLLSSSTRYSDFRISAIFVRLHTANPPSPSTGTWKVCPSGGCIDY